MKSLKLILKLTFCSILFIGCNNTIDEGDLTFDPPKDEGSVTIELNQTEYQKYKGEKLLLLMHKANNCIGAYSFLKDSNNTPFFSKINDIQEDYILMDTLLTIDSSFFKVNHSDHLLTIGDTINTTLVSESLTMYNDLQIVKSKKLLVNNFSLKQYASISAVTAISTIAGTEINGSEVKLIDIDTFSTSSVIDSFLANNEYKNNYVNSLESYTSKIALINTHKSLPEPVIYKYQGAVFFPFVPANKLYLLIFTKNPELSIQYSFNHGNEKMISKVTTQNAVLHGTRLFTKG